jgi:hypothetical protein
MVRSAKRRAKVAGVPFSITKDDFKIPKLCPILGIELKHNSSGNGCAAPHSPSLDRIIPELGYVPGNIQVISHRANTIKNDATPEELMTVALYMSSILSTSQTT